jgi:hypothetical protein
MPFAGYRVLDVIPIESVKTITGVGVGVIIGTEVGIGVRVGVGVGVGIVADCHTINLVADILFPKKESMTVHFRFDWVTNPGDNTTFVTTRDVDVVVSNVVMVEEMTVLNAGAKE